MTRPARDFVLGVAFWLAAACLAVAAPNTAMGSAHSKAAAPDSRNQVLVLMRLPPEHFRPNADSGGAYGDSQGHGARHRIAVRLAHEHGLTLISDWPLPLVGVDCYVMSAPADQSPADVAAALSRDPDVAWSQPMNLYHGQAVAAANNGPLFRVQPAAREWRLADLHQIATGRGVRVAVVDSMIEKTHPDLVGQVEIAENFVSDRPVAAERHGTGVAGIIAARGVGIIGIAPQARLMALRACWQEAPAQVDTSATVCDTLSLAKAIQFAIVHNAQIVNMSLSGPPDPLLSRLLDVALARGVTVVGAFDRSQADGGFPASHAGVVAVIDEPPSARLAGVIAAPGRDVPTTQPGGRWFLVSGSSYAAAHVSGLFALLRERSPRSRGASALVSATTSGAVDACASLVRASGPCNCACSRGYSSTAISRQ